MRRRIRLFGLLVVFTLFLAVTAGYGVKSSLHRPLPLQQPQLVIVEAGDSYSSVMHALQQRGLLGASFEADLRRVAARLYAAFTDIDQHMSVGEYQLQPGDSLVSLLGKIDRGEVLQHSVTLVDGWTFREWRQRLGELKDLKHDSNGLDERQIMARLGMPDQQPEGWFAPDTYFYTRGTSDLEVMRRALESQRKILDAAWAARDENLPYGGPYQALIMASIVEKETAQPDEREEIAGVFVNRLRRGMRLQTDPTVIYGLGDRYRGNLRRADLQQSTPYNTYRIVGLPPTPIAMPGKAAIEAAVHPSDTQDLYFVARGDGSHVFSKTLAAHSKAVREYQLHRRADYRSSPGPANRPAGSGAGEEARQ